MTPLGDEFEIGDDVVGADHADGMAGAMNHVVGYAPGGGRAIDVGEVGEFEIVPAEAGAVDESFRLFAEDKRGDGKGESDREKTSQHVSENEAFKTGKRA
jgi:hypothetical protein